jgi:ubiquinone/menaquinone biosynthesis C-methylase UbiE
MRPTRETFEQWNEEHALKHDLDKFYNHPNRIFRYIENKRIRILLNLADIKNDDLVLEIGCGIGNILERIEKGKLYGLDISHSQIEKAKKRLGNKAILHKSPGEKTPFNDGYFDRIICTEVFEHVFEPSLILVEMNRILKDRGIISLSIPNENLINFTKKLLIGVGLRRMLEPRKSNWDLASKNNLDEWHLHNYSLNLIISQVKNLFEITEIRRIPYFIIPFRYVLKLRKIL